MKQILHNKSITTFTLLFFIVQSTTLFSQSDTPNAWINEFHYDNTSSDSGEAIEIIIENASSYNLSDFTLSLYNGSNGTSYGSHDLSTFDTGSTMGNYTVFSKNISGLQNGSPDGFALDYNGDLIQFISYEGTFEATEGPANGISSIDIDIEEGGSTSVGNSLYLTGIGNQYTDFAWTSGANSFGNVNTGQSFDNGTASPQIIASESTLSGMGYMENDGPGTAQSFTVSGLSLSDNITITPPINYEISIDSIVFLSGTITLTHTSGIVDSNTIWVRLKAGLSQDEYNNEEVEIASTGATTQILTCNGTVSAPISLPNAWFNEFHYDNAGTDSGEAIEIVIENASSYVLSDFTLSLYNGGDGSPYGNYQISTFDTGITIGDFTVFSKNISGLQNGPDGFALDYDGHLIQFISYESAFEAILGSADGTTSINIGIEEDGSTPAENSLYLTGIGCEYSDFTWASGVHSFGDVNTGQLLDNGTASPQIIVSESSLSGMGYMENDGPGTAQTFTVSGLSLSDNITITPPTNYEISTDGIAFQPGTITLTHTSGAVASSKIWVRLTAGLTQGAYNNEEIEITSTGIAAQTLSCNATVSEPIDLPNAWINEFHYDNAGIDSNEFVEIVIEDYADFDLSKLTLSLYNGGNGAVYDSKNLNDFTHGETIDSFTIFSCNFSSIQNGPDGFALDYDGHIIQFISYDGVFTATDGSATGYKSDNIPIKQRTSNPAGITVQLYKWGLNYEAFEWILSEQSPGRINKHQYFNSDPPEIVPVAPVAILAFFVLILIAKLYMLYVKP
ncbi:MAG: hypothetical protein JXR50_11715 [Prolixibacteraceae bacterium]|nr:hypothetical protein [Prolixibacteraceae bacterium]MBN2650397.1 hypothetical protein [Prolixibacteraceae bacterium]